LRLTIKLYQDEYPLLQEDLLRARKGQRRTARLATLASIGLLAERNAMGRDAAHLDLFAQPASALTANVPRGADELGEGALSDEDIASLFGATTDRES
jgi:hypothetical protein